jgi:hypothetical protein
MAQADSLVNARAGVPLATGRASATLDRFHAWCAAHPVLLSALVLAVAPFWQLRWGTVGDTAWLIHVCEQLLVGARLYVDIVETNPPASVMLYMPPVWLATRLGLHSELVTALYSYMLVLLGLGFAGWMAHRAGLIRASTLRVTAPLILALFVLLPGNAFSEREHLGTALLLPLIVLAAWRSRPSVGGPPLWLAATAGVAGAVMVVLKPHFVVVVVACALYVACRRREWRRIFDLEYWAAGLCTLAYAAVVILAFPEFLRDLYPDLRDVYLPIRTYFPILERFALGYTLTAWLVCRLLSRGGRQGDLAPLLLIASLAAVLPVLVQAKAWPYHVYPSMTFALLALILLLADTPRERRPSWILVAVAVVSCWVPFLPTQRPPSDLLAQIRLETPHPSVALVGSDLAYGLPIARLTGGTWVSRNNADWKGSGALYLRKLARTQGRDDDAARLDGLLRDHVEAKLRELDITRPDLVVLQTEEGFWIDHMMAQPRFPAFLADYELMRQEEAYAIYRRLTPAPSPGAGSG